LKNSTKTEQLPPNGPAIHMSTVLNITVPVKGVYNYTDNTTGAVYTIPVSVPIHLNIPLNIYLPAPTIHMVNAAVAYSQPHDQAGIIEDSDNNGFDDHRKESIVTEQEISESQIDTALTKASPDTDLETVTEISDGDSDKDETNDHLNSPENDSQTIVEEELTESEVNTYSTKSYPNQELETVTQILAGVPKFSNISMALFTAFGANTDLQVIQIHFLICF